MYLPTASTKRIGFYLLVFFASMFFLEIFYEGFGWLQKETAIRFFFDYGAVHVYFESSRWVVGEGVLYQTVFSEYPLFANLFYGFFRFLSSRLNFIFYGSEFHLFCLMWMAFQSSLAIDLFRKFFDKDKSTIWLFLTPTLIYQTLSRFDMMAVLLFFYFLFYLKENRVFLASIFLGLCISIKGYALFVLPLFLVYQFFIIKNEKLFLTLAFCLTLSLGPFISQFVIVYSYAGWEGMMMPLKFHSERYLNAESIWDAVIYTIDFISPGNGEVFKQNFVFHRYSKGLQLLFSVGTSLFFGLVWRKRALPRKNHFCQFVAGTLFITFGFVCSALFYSPQFILWLLPGVYFLPSKRFFVAYGIVLFITYFYHPILFDLTYFGKGFKLSVIAMGLIKLWLLLEIVRLPEIKNPIKNLIAKT